MNDLSVRIGADVAPAVAGLQEVPTYPETTIVAQEPLGFRWTGFSPVFSLLIPALSLPTSPPYLTVRLRPDRNAPLPLAPKGAKPRLRFRALAPDIFGAATLDQ